MTYSLRKWPQPFATVNGELVKTAKVKLLHIIESRCQECLLDGTVKDVPHTFGVCGTHIYMVHTYMAFRHISSTSFNVSKMQPPELHVAFLNSAI
jgi:hypothetical protein